MASRGEVDFAFGRPIAVVVLYYSEPARNGIRLRHFSGAISWRGPWLRKILH